MIRSLQARIVLFFSALLISVQLLMLVTIYEISRENVIEQVGQRLAYAENVFRRLLADRSDRIVTQSRLLVADFGFLSTVASGDVPTIRSALDNLASRIKAQRILLMGLDGVVAADTGLMLERQVFPAGINESGPARPEPRVNLALVDQGLVQQAIVPVLAPEHRGWIVIHMAVDVDVAGYLKRLSPADLEITLLESAPSSRRLILSTLPKRMKAALSDLLASESIPSPWVMTLSDHRYLTRRHAERTVDSDRNVEVLLQTDLDSALAAYQVLGYAVVGFACLGVLATVLGGVIIARRVTHPVRILSMAARNIGGGQFDQPIGRLGYEEFDQLVFAFNRMMEGIAQREKHIEHQLLHDPLTGLPNRRYFKAQLDERIQSHDSFAVILLGLDRFAEISNTLGHGFGDRLVSHIGSELKEIMPLDATLARLATDEFAMAVNSPADGAALQQLVDWLLQVFDQPISIDQFTVDVSARAGVSHCPWTGTDAKTLVRNADAALYVARRTGKICQIYQQQDDPYQSSALSLMGELRKGLELGQFALFVQPIVDVKRHCLSHVECLIRWTHPEHGFIPPDRFINLAEQTGHIHRVTAWVLAEAFRFQSLWRSAGLQIRMAVNLSAKDLFQGQLVDVLNELLNKYECAPSNFILEITESAVMEDAEQAMKSLGVLRNKGFRLGMDDFGTGYSSMAYLKRLPLDELKIDKSFVMELEQNQEDATIVESVIDLGHGLGLKIVAEGVESEGSFAMLARFNCDMAQGYWISRPMRCEVFADWLLASAWSPTPPSKAAAG